MKYLILVTMLSPIITHYIKTMLPQLPKKYIPLIAPLLGGIAEGLTRLTVGTDLPQGFGVAAGAAGVAIREVINQWSKDGSDRIGAPCVVALLMATAMLGGCTVMQDGHPHHRDLNHDCRMAEIIANGAMPILNAKCMKAKDPVTDGYCLAIVGSNTAIAACYEAARNGDAAKVDAALSNAPEPLVPQS